MSTIYEFHSVFSPEKLNWKLRVLVRAHNSSYGKQCPIHLKWSSENEFTIRQTDISVGSGPWHAAGTDGRFLFWSTGYGVGKVWSFQDPFRGVILPDGTGGSLVRFRTVSWTGRILTLFAVILLFVGVWLSVSSVSWEPLMVALICWVIFLFPMLKSGKIENNLALLALLEEKLSGPPPEKE